MDWCKGISPSWELPDSLNLSWFWHTFCGLVDCGEVIREIIISGGAGEGGRVRISCGEGAKEESGCIALPGEEILNWEAYTF